MFDGPSQFLARSIRKPIVIAGLVIFLITVLAYIPAMQSGFIWDDDRFLTKNPLINADDGLYRFWFTTEAFDYFPLVSSMLWLEWRLWGMNPFGYHAVNVLLHAVSALLIWQILKKLKIPGAWLAALVFAIHPVNVETVVWITERKNTLPMVFYLLSILFYLQFLSAAKTSLYIASLLTFLSALLAKTSIVMLPFVLLLCVWWQNGSVHRKEILQTVPFFGLALALGMVTIWFQYNVNIGGDVVRADGLLSRLLIAGRAVWFYLYKAVIPLNLSFVYPRWDVNAGAIHSWLPLTALIGTFALCWHYRKSWGRPFLFALGYFVITLFPVLGFFNIYFMKFSLVADHWQYHAIIAPITLIVGIAAWAVNRMKKQRLFMKILPAAVMAGALFVLTWSQQSNYRNEESLWKHTVKKNPAAWMAYGNLGEYLAGQGRYQEAVYYYSKVLEFRPEDDLMLTNIGVALANQGKYAEAIQYHQAAIRINPDNAEAHNNLGVAYAFQGQIRTAVPFFEKALAIDPDYADARRNLNIIKAQIE